MGVVIELQNRRDLRIRHRKTPKEELPLMLSRLLAAGATDFARVALDAWGKQEMEPEELLELCATYAAVAGLENVAGN
ncbi:MAG TPA: hypothetical protein VNT01_02445 [Symbiobacteriaceae bacterium]|nr:hypothetical protein [Symbiobacteriaceae bacterium]